MFREYRGPSIVGIWGGGALFGTGYLISQASGSLYAAAGRLVMAGAAVLFVIGCFMYARGKGRSAYWGIAGLLGPLGLAFLYCLKDNSRRGRRKGAGPAP